VTRLRRAAAVLAVLFAITAGVKVWRVVRDPRPPADPPRIVNDVSRLNPIEVSEIIAPATTGEIVEAVRANAGPVSIGGGRYSMGGQTATERALQIDMRGFNRILAFDPAARTITVQAGATWRQIQERIDPEGLSVQIMQSYANFTVGGSLSVNAHGRYAGLGPIITSVRSFRIVLADGTEVEASPAANPEVFYGAIGGYGGLGVLTEVTLELVENVRVKRSDVVLPVADYARWYERDVKTDPGVVFHNADLYPEAYDTVRAISWTGTEDPVTVPDRLMPLDQSLKDDRFFLWVVADWPFGKSLRRRLLDPIHYRGDPVVWRNYEASYDVATLEPSSRDSSTYVLQEYFVPPAGFDRFVADLRAVLRGARVNAVNVSIRHANADPGSLLAWARGEVFTVVLYYEQGTDAASVEAVGAWTRELIEAALRAGGSYYLPYQLQATEDQFLRAYPRAPEFIALKRRLDPTNKFRNRLWDKYVAP
jgi:FAD/FMN-containing dehydrogenase